MKKRTKVSLGEGVIYRRQNYNEPGIQPGRASRQVCRRGGFGWLQGRRTATANGGKGNGGGRPVRASPHAPSITAPLKALRLALHAPSGEGNQAVTRSCITIQWPAFHSMVRASAAPLNFLSASGDALTSSGVLRHEHALFYGGIQISRRSAVSRAASAT